MGVSSYIIFGLLIFSAVGLIPLALPFQRILRKWKLPKSSADFFPPTVLVLSLRGADPELTRCLRSILNQDYPAYEVRIIVDSREDPAWPVVQAVLAEIPHPPKVSVSPLLSPFNTCSLKCSALIQALQDLSSDIQVVALVDADVIPHRTWLKELVAPLADPQVGATMGNRWYQPSQGRWGSLLRYLWNAATVHAMYLTKIPWGGTFALKTKFLRQANLLEKWRYSISDDVLIYSNLKELGLKLRFVATLMMVNQEECSLLNSTHFIHRQMLFLRLYHPKWRMISTVTLSYALIQTIAWIILIGTLIKGDWVASLWMGGGLLGQSLILLALLARVETALSAIFRTRGEFLSPWYRFRLLLALPLTEFVYYGVIIWATFCRKVEWRGVCYQFSAPQEVQRMP